MGLPHSSRAAVLAEHGKDLRIQELPLPPVLEPGAVLVQISCATLCGTDIELFSGKMTFPGMLPLVLGHEMIGEVVAAGDGAVDTLGRPLSPGRRIGWSESTCGRCYACSVLQLPVACEHRGYGFLQRADRPPYATGGLAEYCYVTPGAEKLLLPDDIPDTWAAASGCAVKTVLRAFRRTGPIRPGSTVAVQGSGALGLVATAVAHLSGAGQVITIGAPADRLDLARRFGADAVVDIGVGSEGIVEAVRTLAPRGADHVFDFAGAPSVVAEAIGMAAIRGTVTLVGTTSPAKREVPASAIMGKELTVLGSINGDIADYYRAVGFLSAFASRMPWDALFSPPTGLAGATARIRSMEQLAEVKAVIDPRLDGSGRATAVAASVRGAEEDQ